MQIPSITVLIKGGTGDAADALDPQARINLSHSYSAECLMVHAFIGHI